MYQSLSLSSAERYARGSALAYPDIYDVTYSYTGFQQSQGDNSFPGTQIDADLAGLQDSVSSLSLFMQNVIRADGALNNGIVTFDSLSPSLQTAGLAPTVAWTSPTLFLVGANVTINSNFYRCSVQHTSGVFATDLAAGKWVLVAALPSAGANFAGAFAGAASRTIQDKARDFVNLKDFTGAFCDGVTPDDAAFTAAMAAAQASNLTVMLPAGTCIISTTAALNLTSGNVTIEGQGQGASIIKVADNAALVQMIGSTGANKLALLNLTLDGNRANNGTATTSSFGVIVLTPGLLIDSVEVKNMQCYGVAFFNPASDAVITNSYFHDIGMTVSGVNNIATGIFAGGGTSIDNLTVTNNRFIDIFPTALPLGDSAAINVSGSKFKIIGNFFRNNYNVGGGQCAISDAGTGAGRLDSVIQGNVCEQTGRSPGGNDSTGAFEVNGSFISVIGNVVRGSIRGGVVIEAAATGCLVEGNIIDGAVNDSGAFPAIDLIGTVTKTAVRNNHIFNRAVGFRNQNGAGASIILEHNYFDPTTVATPVLAGSILLISNDNIGVGLTGRNTYGEGAGDPFLAINGSAAGTLNSGALIKFGRASTFNAQIGYESAILGGTSNNLIVFQGSGSAVLNLYSGGGIKFGHGSSWIANGSVATAMTSLGPTGSHTTVQEWFQVQNASGVTRYIPAY